MSRFIKLAISAALLTVTSVNAAHESPWIFPGYGSGVASTDHSDGAKGRRGAVTVQRPQSWIDNNGFPRANGSPVGVEKRILAQPQSWIQG
jgi:hypothetical protein